MAANEFAFATCLPGMEPALKREVKRTRPELRFAYSRPGLVTFKSPRRIEPDDEWGSAFAWLWGRSLGAVRDPAAAAALIAPLRIDRVHVFPREPEVAVDERAAAESARARTVIDLAPWQALGPGGPAKPGELVADVIVAADETWLGTHAQHPTRPAHPGGAIPVVVPADVPSRAFAKIEEAIAFAKLPIAAGQVAVELGAAPGGAVMALARRGLTVYGVDTGELAPQVRTLPNVHHLASTIGALRWEQLPERIDWLLLDVNLAPQVALHQLTRLIPPMKASLRGAVLTLKLNEWRFVDELPALTQRIRDFGFANVTLQHLPSNRREICAIATARTT